LQMYIPKYKLSPSLLSSLTQIERLYGQLEVLRIPKNLEVNLERINLIKSTYISNSIEGNPLSMPEVTNLILGDRVPANRDEKEVRNYFDILKNLENLQKNQFSIQLTLKIHQELLSGVNERITGKIRNRKVVIGSYRKENGKMVLAVKHEPLFHTKERIKQALNQLFDWLIKDKRIPKVIKTGIFHHQFVFIHPFEDGNGRVCRLLTSLLLMQYGYQVNKYFVLDDWYDVDRILYSDKLHSADSGDKTQWLEYFSEGMKYSLQGALSKVKSAFETLNIESRPTPKEKEVLKLFQSIHEMTSTDVAGKLKISRQQAHSLLSSLLKKDFLDKKGRTKSSYYFLKQ